jgi:hypothetical protein
MDLSESVLRIDANPIRKFLLDPDPEHEAMDPDPKLDLSLNKNHKKTTGSKSIIMTLKIN